MNFDDLMKLPADKAKAAFEGHQAGDWQERFDAQFVNEPGRIYWDRIKSFIASEIAAVREQAIRDYVESLRSSFTNNQQPK